MAAADAGESEAMFEENPHGVGLAPGRPKRAGAGQNSQRAESPAPRGGGSRGGRRGGHARGGGRGRSGGRGRGGGRSAAASAAPASKRKSADNGRANGSRADEDDVEPDDDDDDEDDDDEDGEDILEDAAQPAAAKRSRRASKTWGPSGLACQLGGARWGRDKFSPVRQLQSEGVALWTQEEEANPQIAEVLQVLTDVAKQILGGASVPAKQGKKWDPETPLKFYTRNRTSKGAAQSALTELTTQHDLDEAVRIAMRVTSSKQTIIYIPRRSPDHLGTCRSGKSVSLCANSDTTPL